MRQRLRQSAVTVMSLACLGSAFLLATPFTSVSANPLPGPLAVAFHMQPLSPLDCLVDPVTECGQIVQYCGELGNLTVDVYLYALLEPDYPASDLDLELHWDGAWSLLQFVSCVDGSPDVEPLADGVRVGLQLPQPLVIGIDPTRIGRLELAAASAGSFNSWTFVAADGVPCMVLPAAAGGPCYSTYDCWNWFPQCYTSYHPPVLQVTVPQGGQTSVSLEAWLHMSCFTTFVDDQPWMSLSETDVEPDVRRIDVSIDAADLAIGVHDGLIVAITDGSHDCASVELTVTPPTVGVPEADGSARQTSWGGVKRTYR